MTSPISHWGSTSSSGTVHTGCFVQTLLLQSFTCFCRFTRHQILGGHASIHQFAISQRWIHRVPVGQTTFKTLGSVSPDTMKITEITYFRRPQKQKYGCSQRVNPLPLCQSRRNSDLSSLEDVQSRLWILILRTFCLWQTQCLHFGKLSRHFRDHSGPSNTVQHHSTV